MAALSADFDSNIRNQRAQLEYTVSSSTMGSTPAYIGALAQADGAGNVAPAAGGVTRKIVGQFVKGWNTNNQQTVLPVREGDILLNLNATNTPTTANIGSQVYAESDNEVSTSSSSNAKAGILIAIETYKGVSMARVRVTLEANL